MAQPTPFQGICLVSCGTLRPEVEALRQSGFLDVDRVLYTGPGLHERPRELEKQLARQLVAARETSQKTIVAYGDRCFIDTRDPLRTTDALIQELCPGAVRVNAANCIDMLASSEERKQIAGSEKVYWLTPGWIQHWSFIFKDWDRGQANETFPVHDKAIVLDAIGFFDEYSAQSPERLLEIFDWTTLVVEPAAISLARFKRLLLEQAEALDAKADDPVSSRRLPPGARAARPAHGARAIRFARGEPPARRQEASRLRPLGCGRGPLCEGVERSAPSTIRRSMSCDRHRQPALSRRG